jgi:Cd2+/Zn2+-exporting ATPase
VYAGTINGHGALEIRVTRLVRDTRLAQIIHLVETAQATRAPVQSFVDRFARIYTPVVIGVALLVAIVPAVAGALNPAEWIYRALVLLVIACPCALVISTPVSFVAALSSAARNGVLVKGGAFLERLAAVRVVAFDKTGTLTLGELRVVSVSPMAPFSETELLMYAASVEARSEHPLARAIVARATDKTTTGPASGFRSGARDGGGRRPSMVARCSWATNVSLPRAVSRCRPTSGLLLARVTAGRSCLSLWMVRWLDRSRCLIVLAILLVRPSNFCAIRVSNAWRF